MDKCPSSRVLSISDIFLDRFLGEKSWIGDTWEKREEKQQASGWVRESPLGNAFSALRRLLSIKPSSPFHSFYFPPRSRRLSFRFPFCTLLPLFRATTYLHIITIDETPRREIPLDRCYFSPRLRVSFVTTKSREIARTRKRKSLRNRSHP